MYIDKLVHPRDLELVKALQYCGQLLPCTHADFGNGVAAQLHEYRIQLCLDDFFVIQVKEVAKLDREQLPEAPVV